MEEKPESWADPWADGYDYGQMWGRHRWPIEYGTLSGPSWWFGDGGKYRRGFFRGYKDSLKGIFQEAPNRGK